MALLQKLKRRLAKRILRSQGYEIASSPMYRQLENKDKLAEQHTGIGRWAEFGVMALLLRPMIQANPQFQIVQIGANDGIANDPIHRAIVKNHPRTLLVEPQQAAFEKLKNLYATMPRVALSQVAIAAEAGVRPMYRPTPDAGLTETLRHEVASFSKEHVETHIRRLNRWPDDRPLPANSIEEEQVTTLPLRELLQQRGISRVDLLVIDVEGYDREIIEQYPFEEISLQSILFEDAHMAEQEMRDLWRHLDKLGYDLVPLRFNTLAVRRDDRASVDDRRAIA